MKTLITITTLLWVNSLYSQNYYSYSFSGATTTDLESSILKIEGITSCKIKLKEEQAKGEILFELQPYKKSEDLKNPDPLIQLKRLLSDTGLTPIELTEIKY